MIRAAITGLICILAAAVVPFFAAPAVVIACSPSMIDSPRCEHVAGAAYMAFFGTLDSLAHGNQYGFSINANKQHIEPHDSLAMLQTTR